MSLFRICTSVSNHAIPWGGLLRFSPVKISEPVTQLAKSAHGSHLLARLSSWRPSARQTRALVILLLLLIPIQALTAAAQLSPTFDEGSKLASGYAYLVTGRFHSGLDHPPLAKQLAALPLLIVKHQVPLDIYEWNQDFQWPDQLATPGVDDIDHLFLWARLSIALLTIVLGWVVYRWTTDLFGSTAGVLALFILAFDPIVLAMGGLVNNDIAVATFFALTLYCVWRLVHLPTCRSVLWAGLAFGLAQLSKFSALILVPLICFLVFWVWLIPTLNRHLGWKFPVCQYPRRSLSWYVGSVLGIFAIGTLVIWAGYRFEIGPLESIKPTGDMKEFWLPDRLPEPYRDLIHNFPLLAPMYFKGLGKTFGHAWTGHPAFLAGKYSEMGWWYYFPVAFALKTPLPTLLLLGLGILVSICSIRHDSTWCCHDLYLLLPAAVYAVSSLFVNINIGYRHLLPLLTLLFMLAGRGGTAFRRRGWLAGLIVALCVWLVIESVSIWPNYLAYFNQLAGGPANGYRWLVDSNLDWGQDLRNLKAYMDQRGLQRVKLSYFGSVAPSFYGIEYDCLPSFGIQPREGCPPEAEVKIGPGVYVISATNLQGIRLPDRDAFVWFRNREPTARIGYSLFVYDVDSSAFDCSGKDCLEEPRVGQ